VVEEKIPAAKPKDQPIEFSPANGVPWCGDRISGECYRDRHGGITWHFNPWTGVKRHPDDVRMDPYGLAIWMPGWGPRPDIKLPPYEISSPGYPHSWPYAQNADTETRGAAGPYTSSGAQTSFALPNDHELAGQPLAEAVEPISCAHCGNHLDEATRVSINPCNKAGCLFGPVTAPIERALATQVGGNHYKDMVIQPVEYIHKNGIPFIEGAVIKYVSRWRAKNGVEDLKKARHFLDLLIEMEGKA
jgi:hypothetical protein